MGAQRGHTSRRGLLLGLGAPLLLGGAGLTYVLWPEKAAGMKVRTDLEPLNRRFWTALGDVSDAHWLGYDADEPGAARTVPSPDSRVRLVGLAHLESGTAKRILRDPAHKFEVTTLSTLPAELKPFVPSGAGWQSSETYNKAALAEGLGVIPSGSFCFDGIRDLVYFDYTFLYT
ncbi:hypothetical protein [Streptomyces sp. NBC_00503]|uniref:hypothetical protein n=1 Tax=Streptomyces sp. NBC_00503 TaxID=2903659 RepID=UPI002E822C6C|nr:hypothetical protein [Streptomyces sp. NBC_00503]WUD79882.1 hypothetical protein OG490_04460 [Streptomyces sp. NBC_00503]